MTIARRRPSGDIVAGCAVAAERVVAADVCIASGFVICVTRDARIGCVAWIVAIAMARHTLYSAVSAIKRETILRM